MDDRVLIEDIVCEAGAVFSVIEDADDVREAEMMIYREIEKRSIAVRSELAGRSDKGDSDN